MNLDQELIGKRYPIKDILTGNVVGAGVIKSAKFAQNSAQLVLGFDDNESPIVISFTEALNILDNQPTLDTLPIL